MSRTLICRINVHTRPFSSSKDCLLGSYFRAFSRFLFPTFIHFRFLTCREGSVSVEYWCTGATKVAYIKGSPHKDSSKASFEALPRSATAIELGWSNKFEASLLLCWQSAHSSCSSTNEWSSLAPANWFSCNSCCWLWSWLWSSSS